MIGAQLDTQGYVEGQLLATLAFLDKIQEDFLNNGDDGSTSSFFYQLLQDFQDDPTDGVLSPLTIFARQREADRRVATFPKDPNDLTNTEPFDLSDVTDPRYDERFDPRKTGYTPDPDNEDNPLSDIWRVLLDSDNDGQLTAAEEETEITRALVVNRIIDSDPATRLLPHPTDGDFGAFDVISLAQITTIFVQEFLAAVQNSLVDDAAAEALTSGLMFWGPIETQMKSVRDQVLAGIDDADERDAYLETFRVGLNAARVSTAFAAQIASSTFGGYQNAAQTLAEVFDPKLRITGQLSPTFLGFPMGPPSQSVDVTLSKKELTVRGEFSTLAQVFNMVYLPALVNDRTQIDAHFPFQNLLEDLYFARVPRIDPLANDWRVAYSNSMNAFGLQIGNSQGILFPAGATQYLEGDAENPGKIQVFYGAEHLDSDDRRSGICTTAIRPRWTWTRSWSAPAPSTRTWITTAGCSSTAAC